MLSAPAWALVKDYFTAADIKSDGVVSLDKHGEYKKLKTVSKVNMLSSDMCVPARAARASIAAPRSLRLTRAPWRPAQLLG